MTGPYFVCYPAGSAGRFISHVIWSLITDADMEVEYSKYNSAHEKTNWATSWRSNGSDINHPTVFKQFQFVESNENKLLNTHAFPNFAVINQRFPNSKIVIISPDIDDIPEITLNCVLKNGLELFESKDTESLRKSILFKIASKHYFLKYNKILDLNDFHFDHNDIQKIHRIFMYGVKPKIVSSMFMNPEIPEYFNGRCLVLKYKDLFTIQGASYTALDKLVTYTEFPVNEHIIESYKRYVNGRARILQEYEIEGFNGE